MANDVFGLWLIQSIIVLTIDEIVLMNLSMLIFMDKFKFLTVKTLTD